MDDRETPGEGDLEPAVVVSDDDKGAEDDPSQQVPRGIKCSNISWLFCLIELQTIICITKVATELLVCELLVVADIERGNEGWKAGNYHRHYDCEHVIIQDSLGDTPFNVGQADEDGKA